MKDRFKFRGKIIDGFGEKSGRWVIGDLTETWDYKYLIGFRLEDHPYAEVIKREGAVKSCIEIDPKTVGQCTGLKDKNGTLIFEGDIIDDRLVGVGEVTFNRYAFKTSFKNNIGKWFFDYLESEIKAIKIIGNIHEEAANE